MDLTKINDFMDYVFALLRNSQNYIIFIVTSDTHTPKNCQDTKLELMKNLGIQTDLQKTYRHSFLAAVDGGEVKIEQSSANKKIEATYEFSGHKAEISSQGYKAMSASNSPASVVKIDDFEYYAVSKRGLNFVVWDKESGKVIDSVAFDTSTDGQITRKYVDEESLKFEAIKCSITNIESMVVQVNEKLDALTKSIALDNYKKDFIFWNQARKNDETTLDAKKRFFKSLQTEDYEMSVLHQSTTLLLSEFARICEENDIGYWLNFGTLLGAVRHNGFVPWDDDADVAMMRKDLPKLKKAASKADTYIRIDNYFMIDHRVVNILRIVFKEPTMKQFIDISIYDSCDDDSDARWKKFKADRKDYISQLVQYKPEPRDDPNLDRWQKKGVTNQDHIDAINEVTNKILKSNPVENGDYIIRGFDDWTLYFSKIKGIYKYSDIFPLKKLEFSGRLYNVPNNYEKYLESIYGDIYSLPNDIITPHEHINKKMFNIEKSLEMIEQYFDETDESN